MAGNGKITLANGAYAPSAVARKEKVLLYQWAGPGKGVDEYECDGELEILAQRRVPGTEKVEIWYRPFVVTRPADADGPESLLLMLIAPGALTWHAPGTGASKAVNVPIASDPNEMNYDVMSCGEGLVVVATPIRGHGGVSIFTCTWRELDEGAPLTRTTLLPPDPLQPSELFQMQRAVCFHDAEGLRVLVSLWRTRRGPKQELEARTTVTLDARLGGMPDPTWTPMARETDIFDLHLTPDAHPVALGQVSGSAGRGVKMMVWAAPGAWDDLGDPTDGDLTGMAAASSVYVASSRSPTGVERVLIIQPKRAEPHFRVYRSPYSRTPPA